MLLIIPDVPIFEVVTSRVNPVESVATFPVIKGPDVVSISEVVIEVNSIVESWSTVIGFTVCDSTVGEVQVDSKSA